MRKGFIAWYAAATAMSYAATFMPIDAADGFVHPPVPSSANEEAYGLGAITKDIQNELGIRCTASNGNQLTVDQVLAGTRAQHADLRPGDKLLDARVSADRVALFVQRNGASNDVEIERGAGTTNPSTAGPMAGPMAGQPPGGLPQVVMGEPDSPTLLQRGNMNPAAQSPMPHQGFVSAAGQPPMPQQGHVSDTGTVILPGRVSQHSIPTAPQRLVPLTASMAPGARTPFNLNANKFGVNADQNQNRDVFKVGLNENELKLLASYNIELLVDRSRSMHKTDCPGGLSRWEWCGNQASAMAAALAPYLPNGLTITTFAHTHEVYPHVGAQKIVQIFNETPLQLGTFLGEDLGDRFDDYFSHRRPGSKPLLIVVITDGVPAPRYEPDMVIQTFINATKAMRDPKEVTVAFLQIGGDDVQGRYFLAHLDADLVHIGGRYDIVHSKMFERVQAVGLARALADAVKESLTGSKPRIDTSQFPLPAQDDNPGQRRRRRRNQF